jgi:hypothetical protein
MTGYEIELKVLRDIKISGDRIGDYWYDKDTDTLSFQLPYPVACKLSVEKLRRISVTPAMNRLPYFLKYHNVDQLRQQLMQIQCVMNNAVLLHAAAWHKDGEGTLAVGFPNSGKTTAALMAVKHGAMFCADENVIVKDGIAYPVKRSTSMSWWLAEKVSYPLSVKQTVAFFLSQLRSLVVPIFEPNIWVDLPYERKPVYLTKITYLTPGENQSLRILTDNEFPFFTHPLIQTYAYATGFNLDGVYQRYKELIDQLCLKINSFPSSSPASR